MSNILVTKRKWFWAWQDEKEEAWLAEMAQQGLHLNDVPFPGSYQFKNGEPADYVYRLDYQSLKTKDKDSYLQLFADSGWEQVGDMGGWCISGIKSITGKHLRSTVTGNPRQGNTKGFSLFWRSYCL